MFLSLVNRIRFILSSKRTRKGLKLLANVKCPKCGKMPRPRRVGVHWSIHCCGLTSTSYSIEGALHGWREHYSVYSKKPPILDSANPHKVFSIPKES